MNATFTNMINIIYAVDNIIEEVEWKQLQRELDVIKKR